MLLSLAEHLNVPLRERNTLLEAAGYAPVYRETALEAAAMQAVRGALTRILAANEPNPTLVVNRRYDILLANSAAVELLSFFAPRWKGKNNVAYMLLSEEGLKPAIVNYVETAMHLLRRFRGELAGGTRDARDEELLELMTRAQSELPRASEPTPHPHPTDVLLPVRLRRDRVSMELFSTIATLGTPLDITLQELRIETFFAANEESRAALATVTGG